MNQGSDTTQEDRRQIIILGVHQEQALTCITRVYSATANKAGRSWRLIAFTSYLAVSLYPFSSLAALPFFLLFPLRQLPLGLLGLALLCAIIELCRTPRAQPELNQRISLVAVLFVCEVHFPALQPVCLLAPLAPTHELACGNLSLTTGEHHDNAHCGICDLHPTHVSSGIMAFMVSGGTSCSKKTAHVGFFIMA